MPIIASEPTVYPTNLLGGFSDAASDRLWWVVYTKPRQEKSVARRLLGMNVPFYLPLVPKVNLIRGRRVTSQLPLFGSYLFLFATNEERIMALSTQRIVQLLPAPRTDEMTRDLRNVQALVQAGAPLTVESRLQPGQKVRVKNGSLMGVEGTITERRGEGRLLVAVRFLQQGVSVLIQDFQLEPA